MVDRKIVHLPVSNLAEGDFDPNLSKRFTGDEMQVVWRKIDALAVDEIRKLVLKYEPNLEHDLTPGELDMRVAHIAEFFLRESARRVRIIAYSNRRKEEEA